MKRFPPSVPSAEMGSPSTVLRLRDTEVGIGRNTDKISSLRHLLRVRMDGSSFGRLGTASSERL